MATGGVGRGGKRRSRQEWERLIAQWRAGGESAATFCARRGLRVQTLQWWRWRLRQRPTEEKLVAERDAIQVVEHGFRELAAGGTGKVSASPRSGFELRWPDGLTLWIPADFEATALRRLLAALEASPC